MYDRQVNLANHLLLFIINPRHTRAARVTVVVPCVCMYVCVFVLICHLTHWNHKRVIPTDSSQYGNDKKDDF